MESSNTSFFLSFLKEVAACFGIDAFENTDQAAVGEVGNIEFKNEAGRMMRLQMEQESSPQWPAVRARVIFGLRAEEKEGMQQRKNLHSCSTETVKDCVAPVLGASSTSCTLISCAPSAPSPSSASATMHTGSKFLEAFFVCRLLPGTLFPIAPSILAEEECELQTLFPLDEKAKENLLSFVSFASSFYQEVAEHVSEAKLNDAVKEKLRSLDHSSDALWTLGAWDRRKTASPGSSAIETFSSENQYYRLLPATETRAGMIAINLGDVADFVGLHKIIPLLLKTNAITFFEDNYYIGLDDRQGLLLMALLPPAKKEKTDSLIVQLLQRAADVRRFMMKITTDLEAVRINEIFKNAEGVEAVVLM